MYTHTHTHTHPFFPRENRTNTCPVSDKPPRLLSLLNVTGHSVCARYSLRASCLLTYLTLTATLSGMCYFVLAFTMRKTEVQRVRGHTASLGQGKAGSQAASSHLPTCPPIPHSIPSNTYHTLFHLIAVRPLSKMQTCPSPSSAQEPSVAPYGFWSQASDTQTL